MPFTIDEKQEIVESMGKSVQFRDGQALVRYLADLILDDPSASQRVEVQRWIAVLRLEEQAKLDKHEETKAKELADGTAKVARLDDYKNRITQ